MRKIWIGLLLIALSAGFLAGCSEKDTPVDTPSSAAHEEQTQPTVSQECPIGHDDTYWVAFEWYSEDTENAEGPNPLPTQLWALDLIVRPDGTARFRDIHEGVFLVDDSFLNLIWERTPDGKFLFYGALYEEPVLWGVYEDGILTLEYWGTTLKMKQEPMPQRAGQMYSPAELVGTWLLVSGETEGYRWEAMPNELSSILFRVTSFDGPLVLAADLEERDQAGNLMDSRYAQESEILPEPLYEGCENEAWCLRIGSPSQRDENGYPTETEFYVTLIDYNTLLMQRCYTLDGSPAVSHQTYRRLPDLVSWMAYESMNLNYSNWVCTGYEDFSGAELPLPPELDGFSVVLSPDQTCQIYFGDSDIQEGTWVLENGGVLLLRGDEASETPFWFGGVISGYWVEAADALIETYQMALYYNGGVLKLAMNSYG